jgi:hypothetical protein
LYEGGTEVDKVRAVSHNKSMKTDQVTSKQLSFIESLDGDVVHAYKLTRGAASEYINELLDAKRSQKPEAIAELTAGVYEVEGTVYVVKPNQQKTRLYAKRLVEINAQRSVETGERVRIEFEYEAGAIYKIKPEHKMELEKAKQLTIRYGRCIVCGAQLKDAKSVERGIGPVCIKSFATLVNA